MKSFYYTLAVVFLASSLGTACSVSKLLVGQVDPVDQKSNQIEVTPLELIDPTWKRIDSPSNLPSSTGNPDRAWQSTKSASVISLNSACREESPSASTEPQYDLKAITRDLLSQWTRIEEKNERELTFSNHPALETSATGVYLNRKRRFQTLVVKTPSCVYDLILLSPPKSFSEDLATFEKFRDKLVIK